MIRAIIVDDEMKSAELLQLKLNKYCPQVDIVKTFGDASLVPAFVQASQVDIAFLDIEMPGVDGLNLARDIKAFTEIVFVTAYDKYSIEALRIAVLDYLLKPVQEAELKNCIGRLEDKLEKRDSIASTSAGRKTELKKLNAQYDKIALPTLEGIHFFNVKDIVRVASESNYSIFFFDNKKKLVVSKTLKQVEEILEPYHFFRPHRSHLINMDYISTYVRGEGGTIILTDGSEIEVSRNRKKEFLDLMGLA